MQGEGISEHFSLRKFDRAPSLSLFETKDLRDGVASPPFAGWNKP